MPQDDTQVSSEATNEQVASTPVESKPQTSNVVEEQEKGVNSQEVVTVPSDIPEELKPKLQEYQKGMQSQYTKRMQEIAQMKRDYEAKMEQVNLALLNSLNKPQEQQKAIEDMTEDELIQYKIQEATLPLQEELQKIKSSYQEQEARKQYQELNDYAQQVGLDIEQYVDQIKELDAKTGQTFSFVDLFKMVAKDDIISKQLESEKSKLMQEITRKANNTIPTQNRTLQGVSTGKMTFEEAFRRAINQ